MFPQITSLCYIVNTKLNDSVGDLRRCATDEPYRRGDGGLRFKVGPKSFYQTSSEQAYELWVAVRRPETQTCSTTFIPGTIANFCAAHCPRVVSISMCLAIADAKINSRNQHRQYGFLCGRRQVLCGGRGCQRPPDVVIL